jgi:hypothetical protein
MRPRHTVVLVALGLWLVATLVPFGQQLLYPFTLLATWVHEMGHGLTAIALGGDFLELEIHASAGGFAVTTASSEARHALVCLGGLLAPPLVGALGLAFVHGPRRARLFLLGLAGLMALSTIVWVRSAVGLLAVPLTAVVLGLVAVRLFRARPERRVLLAQAISVMLAADTVTRMIGYVFKDAVLVDGKPSPSDIAMVAEGLGGPQVMWGVIVTAVALALLGFGLWRAWKADAQAGTSNASSMSPSSKGA